jgi:hypothetical protein
MIENESVNIAVPACTDDQPYSEALLTELGTKGEREQMVKTCVACSEYIDCLEDVIAAGKAWEFHQIHVEATNPLLPTERPLPPNKGSLHIVG